MARAPWPRSAQTAKRWPISEGPTVCLWNVVTGHLLATLTDPASMSDPTTMSVNSVAFSPDGATLATGDGDGVQLWDVGGER